MRYIQQYDRWYCDFCKEYAPAGYTGQNASPVSAQTPVHEEESTPLCPKCGRPLTYIKEYDRWYCYNCKEYAPKDISPSPSASVPVQSSPPVAQQQPTKVMQPVQQNASQPAVRRFPSHSHAGDPGTGGWVMLLGFLLVLTDEIIYILLRAGAITNLNPPIIGGDQYGFGLPLYGSGLGSLLGISGLLIFMIGGVMAALASRVR